MAGRDEQITVRLCGLAAECATDDLARVHLRLRDGDLAELPAAVELRRQAGNLAAAAARLVRDLAELERAPQLRGQVGQLPAVEA